MHLAREAVPFLYIKLGLAQIKMIGGRGRIIYLFRPVGCIIIRILHRKNLLSAPKGNRLCIIVRRQERGQEGESMGGIPGEGYEPAQLFESLRYADVAHGIEHGQPHEGR